MAGWGPFLAVIAVLTLLLLVLSRQSQAFIHEHAERENSDRSGTVADAEDSPGTDEPDRQGQAPDGAATGPDDSAPAGATDAARGSPAVREDPTGADGVADTEDRSQTIPEDPIDAGVGDGPGEASPEVELTSGVMLANVASTQALFGGVVLVAAWYFSIPAEAFGVTADPLAAGLPGVGLGLAVGLGLWLANEFSTTVADAVGAAYDETVRELLAPGSARGWVAMLVVVLPLIAFAEELLFRAALIGVPAAGFGVSPWLLAVVASLAFALGHGAQGQVGVVVTGLLGFALAAGYILTGSLLVVVVAHYVINAMEFLVHEYLGVEQVLPPAVQPG